MKIAAIPQNEEERLRSLYELDVLTKTSNKTLDELTELASTICETPVSLVTLVDKERQFFKSKIGIDLWETSRDISFCAHAILEDEITIVEDATTDQRFHDNPLVTGPLHVRFYAGFPIKTIDKLALGTLCVADVKPRQLTQQQKQALKVLAHQVAAQLELLRFSKRLQQKNKDMEAIFSNISLSIMTLNESGQVLAEYANQIHSRLGATTGMDILDIIETAWATEQQGHSLRKQVQACFSQENPLISLQLEQLPRAMYLKNKGSERSLELIWDPIWSPEKTLDRLVLTLKDVTEEQQEQEQRLALSEKMAVMGDLVYDLSHEIRNAQAAMLPNLDSERPRYRLLFESLGLAALWADIEGQAINLNHLDQLDPTFLNQIMTRKDLSSEQKSIILSLIALGFSREKSEEYCLSVISKSNQKPTLALLGLLQTMLSVTTAGQRMSHLIESILDHSKQSEGRKPFGLKTLISSSTVLLSKFARRMNVRFHIDPSCEVFVVANESDIHQIVLNLTKNALEAFESKLQSSEAKIIRFSTQALEDRIKLIVEDNAGGISDPVLERLFERRFTTKGSKGNGLGLYLSRKLAHKNQGVLEVQSRDGKSYFYLILPGASTKRDKAA